MRWIDPVVWLCAHLGDPVDAPALVPAAVLFALHRESGARWLFAPSGEGSWIAVRNACAASYRGEGLRLRIVVGENDAAASPMPSDGEELHLCRYSRRPARLAGTAGVGEWSVEREGDGLMVARMNPGLTLKVDARSLAAAIER